MDGAGKIQCREPLGIAANGNVGEVDNFFGLGFVGLPVGVDLFQGEKGAFGVFIRSVADQSGKVAD